MLPPFSSWPNFVVAVGGGVAHYWKGYVEEVFGPFECGIGDADGRAVCGDEDVVVVKDYDVVVAFGAV